MKQYIKKNSHRPTVDLGMKRIYVASCNLYAWFWIIREAFYRQSASWEEWLLFGFFTTGMYYFGKDNPDLLFKFKKIN